MTDYHSTIAEQMFFVTNMLCEQLDWQASMRTQLQ